VNHKFFLSKSTKLLFIFHFNHLSLRRPLSNKQKTAVDYIVDYFVNIRNITVSGCDNHLEGTREAMDKRIGTKLTKEYTTLAALELYYLSVLLKCRRRHF
jgi:hypothetical protein